jgi:hypothetical protein
MNRIHTIPALLAAAALLAAPGCNKRSSLTETGDAGDTAAASDDATSDDATSGGDASTSGGDGDTGMDTASDDSTDTTDDDCGGFLGCPDMPRRVVECDYWAQDCPEGQKCRPASTIPGDPSWNTTICVDAGTDPLLAPCTLVEDADPYGATDTCDEQGMCLFTGGSGICHEFCAGDPENPTCPITGWECDIAATGTLDVCIPRCAPIPGVCPDCWDCPGDQACIAAWEGDTLGGFICFPLSAEGAAGESCECANCCAAGLMCTDAATYGPGCAFDLCCTEFCDITNLALMCTGPDQQCVALFDPTDPHYANVGACMVP